MSPVVTALQSKQGDVHTHIYLGAYGGMKQPWAAAMALQLTVDTASVASAIASSMRRRGGSTADLMIVPPSRTAPLPEKSLGYKAALSLPSSSPQPTFDLAAGIK